MHRAQTGTGAASARGTLRGAALFCVCVCVCMCVCAYESVCADWVRGLAGQDQNGVLSSSLFIYLLYLGAPPPRAATGRCLLRERMAAPPKPGPKKHTCTCGDGQRKKGTA
jgi:hypothetical protein